MRPFVRTLASRFASVLLSLAIGLGVPTAMGVARLSYVATNYWWTRSSNKNPSHLCEAARSRLRELDGTDITCTEWDRAVAEEAALQTEIMAYLRLGIGDHFSSREHAQALHDGRIRFMVDPPQLGFERQYDALYEGGAVHFNGFDIALAILYCRMNWTTTDRMARFIAVKLLPALVHEVRHAIDERRLKKEGLGAFKLSTQEEEYSAYADQIRFLREADEKPRLVPMLLNLLAVAGDPRILPMYDKFDELLLTYGGSSPKDLRGFVRRIYGPRSPHTLPAILDERRADILKRVEHDGVMCDVYLAYRQVRGPHDKVEGAALLPLHEVIAKRDRALSSISVLSDAAKFQRLRAFYISRAKEVDSYWKN